MAFVGAKRIQSGTEVIIAEAEAILWALSFVRDLALPFVVIESDSLGLINRLRKRVVEVGVLGTLVHRICQAAS